MGKRKFIESLNDAIDGLIKIFREQKNMRFHFLVVIFLLLLGLFLGMSKIELIILFIATGVILLMETINSCIEDVLDFLHPEYNPKIKVIKDMWAGAVLFSGILAGIVCYLLFSSYLVIPVENGIQRLKETYWYFTFFTLLLVISIVIIIKAFFHKGRPLRGGLPSGHSAVAFSIWTMVLFLQPNIVIATLVLILAILIAVSRIRQDIHSVSEVFLGALIGILITLLIFQILS
jgi:diacylglycerol kinase (ATP)